MQRAHATTLTILAGATIALAQDESQPDSVRPEGNPIPAAVVPGAPSESDALPALRKEDVRVPAARLLREGSLIIERTGSLLRSPAGEWIIAFPRALDAETGAQGRPAISPPPMPILPSRQLELIVRAMGDADVPVAITVTGEVTRYHNRNYLLPTRHRLTRIDTSEPSGDDSNPTTDPQNETEQDPELPTTDDPRVQELFEDLEAAAPRTPTPRAAPDAPDAFDTAPALNEGKLVSRRSGFFERHAGGRLVFVAGEDRFAMLPCRQLQLLESVEPQVPQGTTFRISGRVYRCLGTTYLLLDAWSTPPRTNLAGG